MKARRVITRWFWILFWLLALFILGCNRWVINSTDDYIYRDWSLLPVNDVGIVLGTSPYTGKGEPNPQFRGRIEAAVQLYDTGKIKHIIVSGSNPDETYNEPREMWRELTAAGVPSSAITMDFAGLRTLDSMARAQQVFGLSRCTVITQKYHAHRAVFIGRKLGMKVVAYAAKVGEQKTWTRSYWREVLARVKAVSDLFIIPVQPRFLGDREPIKIDNGDGDDDSGSSPSGTENGQGTST